MDISDIENNLSDSDTMSVFTAERAPTSFSDFKKSELTRKSILDAALDFLWQQPFREMTVGKLMSIAGASRSAFYQYFTDLHDLMETLLHGLEKDIFDATNPWIDGKGNPVDALRESQAGLVRIGYKKGPILRAVADASSSDERLERAWEKFLAAFDDAVAARIEQHQQKGLIPAFDARPAAIALNRLDASMLINAFGRCPRNKPGPVHETLTRIWTSTLYGFENIKTT